MAIVLDGCGASDGIAAGKIFHLEWGIPIVPHMTIAEPQVEAEIQRFHAARAWAKQRLHELQRSTEARLGPVEARIFEPQILMLEDEEIVAVTVR